MLVMGRPAPAPATVTGSGRDSPLLISSSSSTSSSFRELDDVFLQTQTRIWLGEVLETRFEDQLHISDLLSDGELLFEVSRILWNMLLVRFMDLRHVKAHKWIPVGSRKRSGRYMPYSNVDSFLKVCKVFGMDGIDLLSPSDVVEKRDTRKVCICIRSLSKKARSKQLNVPDFDIVTYTIAMPTDIVGCIRKSLEQSRGSIIGPVHRPYKDKRLNRRQSSVAACEQSSKSWLVDSDEAESSSIGRQSFMSYTDTSHIDPLYLDLENSAEVPSEVKDHSLAQDALYVDMHDQETDESEQCRYNSECVPELEESICLRYIRNGSQLNRMSSPGFKSQVILCHKITHLNGARHGHEKNSLDLVDGARSEGNDASSRFSFPGDNRVEVSHIFQQLTLSDLTAPQTGTNDFVLIEEDSLSNSCMDTESYGSNSTPTTCESGIWMRSPDNIDDVEVSSKTSMSSMLGGRVLDFGFDAKWDENDPRAIKSESSELQYYQADGLDKGSARSHKSQDQANYGRLLHSAAFVTKESHIGLKLESSDFSADSLIRYWDDWKLYTSMCQGIGLVDNQINLIQRNSVDAFWVKKTNMIVTDIDKEPLRKVTYNDQVSTCAGLLDLGPDIKELEGINFPTDCCNNILDGTSEDSIGSCNCCAIEERCQNSFQHQCTTFQDVGSKEGNHAPQIDIFGNQCELSARTPPIGNGTDDVDKACRQAFAYHNKDVLLGAEHTSEETIKNEREDSGGDYLSKENSNGRNYNGAGEKQKKPTFMGPLLKTVAKGTALIGVLFLLHLRIRSEREKEGASVEHSGPVQKSNGMQFSSRKGKRGSEIYPAEKLKLGD